MPYSFKMLRPAGNPVKLQKTPLSVSQFDPFQIDFYYSGTTALAAAIIACNKSKSNLTARPEVILPAYGCPDLVSAILYAGVRPVLVDLDPDSPWMSLAQIEQAISVHTTAILAVRFLGISERMDELLKICRRHKIMLIEDSAQGFPVTDPATYWRGDFNILSFGRGKPVSLLSGGAVLTKQPELRALLPITTVADNSLIARAIYLAKTYIYNLMINPVAYGLASIVPGLNIGATIYKPLHELLGMPDFVKERLNANIQCYKQLRQAANLIRDGLNDLNMPDVVDLATVSDFDYANPLLRYPLLIRNQSLRDLLYDALSPFGASKMYKRPIYKIDSVPRIFPLNSLDEFPNAQAFSDRLITLPTHQEVTDDIITHIKIRMANILKQAKTK